MSDRINVTYLNINSDPTKGSIVATMGMHIISMDFYMAKLLLIRRKDGGLYIAYPNEKYVSNKTGREEFSNYFWFGKKTADFFQIEGFKAIQAYCQQKGLPDPTNGQSPILKNPPPSVFET